METAALEKVYQARHTYQLFEDSIPTLEALRGKYKLGVISDTWPSIVPVLEEFGLPGYFDTLTVFFVFTATALLASLLLVPFWNSRPGACRVEPKAHAGGPLLAAGKPR